METLTYKYHPRVSILLVPFVTVVLGTLFFGYMALNNDRGLIIDYIFKFDADSATLLYWFFCIFFLLGAFFFAALLSRSLFSPPGKVILTGSEVSVPSALTGKVKRTKLASIKRLTIYTFNEKRSLEIKSGQAKIQVGSGCFDNEGSFDEFCGHLKARISLAR